MKKSENGFFQSRNAWSSCRCYFTFAVFVNYFICFSIFLASKALLAQPINFAYSKLIVDPALSPTGEFIFPTVIQTDHIQNPLGRYYLYYAPHDSPGGISLAYSNSITGPWVQYAQNPILGNRHQGKFRVSHVSSPHVMWMAQYNKYFMYFHGENNTTRWAHSEDGINWDLADNNVAITASSFGPDFTEASYARVFEYSIPGMGNRYIMVLMTLKRGHGRHIGLATSSDGKHFTARNWALVSPRGDEGNNLSAPYYWVQNGRHYIVYHAQSGNIHYTEVGPRFDMEIHHGVFYKPSSHFPEYGKAADFFPIYANNRWNLFYTVGTRLRQTIAYAFEVKSHDIIIDNTDPGFHTGGTWQKSSSIAGYHGSDYLHDNSPEANPGNWAMWRPNFPRSGYYKVMVRWPGGPNRPTQALYRIYHRDGVSKVTKNQQINSGSWVYLGRYYFEAGVSQKYQLTLDAANDDGYTIADAARFIHD